jgi:hypothetical protein
MKKRKKVPAQGEIRQSQVVTTFGPGSFVDLPKHSVLIGGLDHWPRNLEEVPEPRLAAKLRNLLKVPELRLCAPPPMNDDPAAPDARITAWQFPSWFITQTVLHGDGTKRARALVHRKGLREGQYLGEDRKKYPVVPVRFVRACLCGHVGDIGWRDFVHQGEKTCSRQLWFDERGTTGDINDIDIRCECGKSRPLVHATELNRKALGQCDGQQLWLGPKSTASWCGPPATPTSRV